MNQYFRKISLKVSFIALGLFVLLNCNNDNSIVKHPTLYETLVSKPWRFYIFKYNNSTEFDSSFHEVTNLNRSLVFKQDRVSLNIYYNNTMRRYDTTYGTWDIKDSSINISFKRDDNWVYQYNKDSVRLNGKIVVYGDSFWIVKTFYKYHLNKYFVAYFR